MKYPFLVFFTLICQLSFGQKTEELISNADRALENFRIEKAKASYLMAIPGAPDDSTQIYIFKRLSTVYRHLSNYDSALYYLDRGIEVRSNTLIEADELAELHIFRARVLLASSDLDGGLKDARLALELLLGEIAPDLKEELDSFTDLEGFYTAYVELIKEHDLLEKLERLRIPTSIIIADLLSRNSLVKPAEQLIEQSVSLYQNRGDIKNYIEALRVQGNIYYMGQKYGRALQKYHTALNYYKQREPTPENSQILATAYLNLELAHTGTENYDSARYYVLKALDILKSNPESPVLKLSQAYANLGHIHFSNYQLDSAIHYMDMALDFNTSNRSEVLFGKGRSLYYKGEYTQAVNILKQAVESATSKKTIHYINVLNTIGEIYQYHLDMAAAFEYYDKALMAGAGKGFDVSQLAEFNDFESLSYPINFLSSLLKKADLLAKYSLESNYARDIEQALALLHTADRLIAYLRASFVLEDDNINFSETISGAIETFLQANLIMYEYFDHDPKYLVEAFRYADMNKSQVLLESMKRAAWEHPSENSLLGQWIETKADLDRRSSKLKHLQNSDKASTQALERSKTELEEVQNRYEKLFDEISHKQPNLLSYISGEIRDFSYDSLRSYLQKTNSIMIQYFTGYQTLYQFLVTPDTIGYFAKLYDFDQVLKKPTNELNHFLNSPSEADPQKFRKFASNAKLLYDDLMVVLPEKHKDKNLIIIPDSHLASIPFEVLLTELPDTTDLKEDYKHLSYMMRDWNISYAFSNSVFLESSNHEQHYTRNNSSTGWAPYSDESALGSNEESLFRDRNLGKLVGASREVKPLSDIYDGRIFVDQRASETRFKDLATRSDILHIATHGVVDHKSPEMSYLLFADETGKNDGVLHLYELYDLPLNNDLTILSACETGVGDMIRGEGVMSMARAFTHAGARSVVMSLWLANDNSTSQIVQGFYNNLDRQQTKSKALTASKLSYLESANNVSAHPFYWAHIITTGSNEVILAPVKSKFNLLWLLVLIIPVAFFWKKTRHHRAAR